MENIGRIGIEEWKNCIQHVTNEEGKKMCDLDNAIHNVVDSLIINFSSNSLASSSESDLYLSVLKFIKFLATCPALSLSLTQLFFSQKFSLYIKK